jgi:hypothetical protein
MGVTFALLQEISQCLTAHHRENVFYLPYYMPLGGDCRLGGAGGIIMIFVSDHFEPSITGVLALRSCGPETGFKAKFSLS